MENTFLMWMYRLISVYLSLWTQGPREPSRRETLKTRIMSGTDFSTQVHKCLETFQILRTHVEPSFYYGSSRTLYLHLYKETYCRQYEESLQCLHELLSKYQKQELTTIVQARLSEPWALHTNQLCEINVKQQTHNSLPDNSTTRKQNNTSQNPPSVKSAEMNTIGNPRSIDGISRSKFSDKVLQSLSYISKKYPNLHTDKDNDARTEILFALFKVTGDSSPGRRLAEGVHDYGTKGMYSVKQMDNTDSSKIIKSTHINDKHPDTLYFQPAD